MFLPYQIRVVYQDNTNELIAIDVNKNEYVGQRAKVVLNADERGVIMPVLTALEDISPGYMNIEFSIPEDLILFVS